MFEATGLKADGSDTVLKEAVKLQLSSREKWADLVLPLEKVLELGLGIAEVRTIPFVSFVTNINCIYRSTNLSNYPSVASKLHMM